VDAQRWLDEVTTSIVTGAYVASGAGRITFREYAEGWRAMQVHRPTTTVHVEGALRRRVYPVIGDQPLESIVPSDIQALVKRLEQTLAPPSVIVTYRYVSTIFRAAVRDRRIALTPCDGIRLPKNVRPPVTPMTTEEVQALSATIPERYRAMVVLAAGTGLRQGEIFGLTIDRVDFLRQTLTVDRQLVGMGGQAPTFGPPKTAASMRTLPLPDVVLEALAEHVRHFPPGPHGAVCTGSDGQLLRRSAFGNLWRRVNTEAGVEGRTFHSLRHYYASLLIRHGGRSRPCKRGSGTPAPPRPSTLTATCGPTPTTRRARRSTRTSALQPAMLPCWRPPTIDPGERGKTGRAARQTLSASVVRSRVARCLTR
jgi:integrase